MPQDRVEVVVKPFACLCRSCVDENALRERILQDLNYPVFTVDEFRRYLEWERTSHEEAVQVVG